MRFVLASLIVAALPALAQPPAPAPAPKKLPPQATCAECGVIRSVRPVVKPEPPAPGDASKPSGLVATVPLGGGKPQVGSSTKFGRDISRTMKQWEVVVRYDDGRFTALMLDEPGDWKEGDKVKIDKGKLTLRTD